MKINKIKRFPNECIKFGCGKPTNGHPSKFCYSCREKVKEKVLKKEQDYGKCRTVCRMERASGD